MVNGVCAATSSLWALDMGNGGLRRQLAADILPSACDDAARAGVVAQGLAFAPDSRRLAYVAAQGAGGTVGLWQVDARPTRAGHAPAACRAGDRPAHQPALGARWERPRLPGRHGPGPERGLRRERGGDHRRRGRRAATARRGGHGARAAGRRAGPAAVRPDLAGPAHPGLSSLEPRDRPGLGLGGRCRRRGRGATAIERRPGRSRRVGPGRRTIRGCSPTAAPASGCSWPAARGTRCWRRWPRRGARARCRRSGRRAGKRWRSATAGAGY